MINSYHIRTGSVWEGDCSQGWIEPNRKIYDYEMVFFSRGTCRVITENQTFPCKEGSVLIIPPNHEHCSIADTLCTRWCIHFDWYGTCPAHKDGRRIYVFQDEEPSFSPEDSAELYRGDDFSFPAVFQIPPEERTKLLTLFRQFFEIFPDSSGAEFQRLGIFLQILGTVMSSGKSPSGEQFRNVSFFHGKRLLDRYFSDSELEIRQVAEELRITPNHLNKLFRQYLGVTPSLYLQNRRLLQAETLLKNTSRTIREIAFACGFSDANYFTRCFRNKNGMTPGEYRRIIP